MALCCYANKLIVCGIWYTYVLDNANASQQGTTMSSTTSFAFVPSATPLSRLLAAVDRWLLAYAEITIRNGDIPRYCV
jgi:hypothetical protein